MTFHLHRWRTLPPDEQMFVKGIGGLTFCLRCGKVKERRDIRIEATEEEPGTFYFTVHHGEAL